MKYTYKAIVISVHDGDTLTVNIDLGFGIWIKEQSIRLHGINTPELKGTTKEKGLLAKARLSELTLNKEIVLETIKDKKEKYGRLLGRIFVNSELINEKLVQEGLAQKYLE